MAGSGSIRSLGRIGCAGLRRARGAVGRRPRIPGTSGGRYFWKPNTEDADRCWPACGAWPSASAGRAVLITTDDAGAIFLAEHGVTCATAFLFPRPARGPARGGWRASTRCTKLCRELGVPCPHADRAGIAGGGAGVRPAAGYPLIAKLDHAVGSRAAALRSTSIVASRRA